MATNETMLGNSWIYSCLKAEVEHTNLSSCDIKRAVICSTTNEHNPPFGIDEHEVANIISDFYLKIYAVYSSKLKAQVLENLHCCTAKTIHNLKGHSLICFKYHVDMRHSTAMKEHINECGSSKYKCPQEYHVVLVIKEMDSSGCSGSQSNPSSRCAQNSCVWYHDIEECALLIQAIIKNKLDSEYDRLTSKITDNLYRQNMVNKTIENTRIAKTGESQLEQLQSQCCMQHYHASSKLDLNGPAYQAICCSSQKLVDSTENNWKLEGCIDEQHRKKRQAAPEVIEVNENLEIRSSTSFMQLWPSELMEETLNVMEMECHDQIKTTDSLNESVTPNLCKHSTSDSHEECSVLSHKALNNEEISSESSNVDKEVDVEFTDMEPVAVDEHAFPEGSPSSSSESSDSSCYFKPKTDLEGIVTEVTFFPNNTDISQGIQDTFGFRCVPRDQYSTETIEWKCVDTQRPLVPTMADLIKAQITEWKRPQKSEEQLPGAMSDEGSEAIEAKRLKLTTEEELSENFTNFIVSDELMSRTLKCLYLITKPRTQNGHNEYPSTSVNDTVYLFNKPNHSAAKMVPPDLSYSTNLMNRTYQYLCALFSQKSHGMV